MASNSSILPIDRNENQKAHRVAGFSNPLNKIIMNTFLCEGVVHPLYHDALLCLFGVDNGFVNGIPASGIDTPIVGGVLVAIDSDFPSL